MVFDSRVAIVRRNGLGDFIAGTVPLYNYIVENKIFEQRMFF